MRILVITSETRWVDAVRTALGSGSDVVAADATRLAGVGALLPVMDACLIAETELGVATVEVLKQLGGTADVPLFAVAERLTQDGEEAALMAGAQQVFRAPLRAGIVRLAISRSARYALRAPAREPVAALPAAGVESRPGRELELLRDFSRLLMHGAGGPEFADAYLETLADVLGCGRLILFSRREDSEAMFAIEASTGVDAQQFEGFRLHLGHGLGRLVASRGGVIARKRLRPHQPDEAVSVRELAVFGAELAVPLAGREGVAGLLLVGARVAGGDYTDADMTQVYRVMEAFAAARVRGAAPVVSAAADAFPAILHALPIGCAMLNESLRVLEANDAFRSQLGRGSAHPLGLERLPAGWVSAIESLRTKRGAAKQVELDHELSGAQRRVRLTIEPLQVPDSEPRWLMITEDITVETRLQQELHDRSVHNVLQRAGEQLSNEFRNALTPIEILVQLSSEAGGRRDTDRLRAPVSMAIHRLRRRVDNLGYLTKTAIVPELTTVSAVFRSARERLDTWLEPKQLKTLVWSGEFSKVAFTADQAAVGLAIAELVMNAVEAAGGRQVTITADDLPEAVHFKVRNPGEWAPPSEITGFGHRPFFTAKSAGVGLGVEVATRVAEYHGGRLVLGPVSADIVEAIVRLPRNLPLAPVPPTEAGSAS